MQTIVIIEDERDIAHVLRSYLTQAGFRALVAHDGRLGLDLTRREKPALVILDLMLPGLDGLDICRALRRDPDPAISETAILILTARVEETDRLIGLELGADDYVSKPFSPREVVARVRTILRRTQPRPDAAPARPLVMGGAAVELTPTEFDLLYLLMNDAGRPFTRMELLEKLQGDAYEGYERTIDVHVKNLRRKLGDASRNPRFLLTILNYGYKFADH